MGPIHIHAITVNCLDAESQAAFWAAVADQVHDETRWRVMADPEGNPFCLVPG
jgi:hypothetical protein